jgi:DNA-damage-inducible protein D
MNILIFNKLKIMEQAIITQLHKNFEDCVHTENGVEFWLARELQKLLGYERWENFENVISRAKIACKNAKQDTADHFRDVTKTIPMPKEASKNILDIMLTRYACYLIAQNGDPRKNEIAFAMTYFAVQTRKQEMVEQRLAQWERLQAREKLSLSEKELSGVLFERGVDSQGFARIRSKGDSALFGGYTTSDMKNKLRIPTKRPLADFLPSVTIKAKDLANEITNHNVKKDLSMRGEPIIINEHVKNNENMREMLKKSGIYPESLPPEEDIKKLQSRLRSADKKLAKSGKKLLHR